MRSEEDNIKIKEMGMRIRNRRTELNLTQEELADKLGYKSRSTINKIELGINEIHPTQLAAFAEALQTSKADLLGWGKPQVIVKKIDKSTKMVEYNILTYELIRKFEKLSDDDKDKVLNFTNNLLKHTERDNIIFWDN